MPTGGGERLDRTRSTERKKDAGIDPLLEPVRCPECHTSSVVEDITRGERVCGGCGLVLSDHRIDTGAEWRAFSAEESDARSRVGAPVRYTIHDKGLSTVID